MSKKAQLGTATKVDLRVDRRPECRPLEAVLAIQAAVSWVRRDTTEKPHGMHASNSLIETSGTRKGSCSTTVTESNASFAIVVKKKPEPTRLDEREWSREIVYKELVGPSI